MFNFCRHKWAKVYKGYQYCVKCGKAKLVECDHKYSIIDKLEIMETFGGSKGYIYTLQCEKCGVIYKQDHTYKDSYERIIDKLGNHSL